ncbi:YheC/YheD family protein [Marinicrinis sediminis]|uniref:YheC/YheD family protein n=1 Tax=Marinicrinis sediminis TaxID=1652465 RepID=A0ABW5RA32_9BACL
MSRKTRRTKAGTITVIRNSKSKKTSKNIKSNQVRETREQRKLKKNGSGTYTFHLHDKKGKTRLLLKHPTLRSYIPETKTLSKSTLSRMLNRYHMVYMKPRSGSMGRGVMRVEQHPEARKHTHNKRCKKCGGTLHHAVKLWGYQLGLTKKTYTSYAGMYRSLNTLTEDRAYLIQKGIHLLKHRGQPFDIRIMVQKNEKGTFICTGMVARMAKKGRIVTNGSQGGSILPVKPLLERTIGISATRKRIRQMEHIALLTAKELRRHHAAICEIGLDIALDQKGYPWILEVNTRPDPCPFTLLDDPRPLRKIVRYGKGYGRRYKLICKKARKGKL